MSYETNRDHFLAKSPQTTTKTVHSVTNKSYFIIAGLVQFIRAIFSFEAEAITEARARNKTALECVKASADALKKGTQTCINLREQPANCQVFAYQSSHSTSPFHSSAFLYCVALAPLTSVVPTCKNYGSSIIKKRLVLIR